MEPFVIGSLWGHLSGENSATVTSLGTRFGPFTDAPDDLWGVGLDRGEFLFARHADRAVRQARRHLR
jgi:hypothetical protein